MVRLIRNFTGGALALVLFLAIALAISACWWGWLLMLGVGASGAETWGFAHCWLLGIPISFILG